MSNNNYQIEHKAYLWLSCSGATNVDINNLKNLAEISELFIDFDKYHNRVDKIIKPALLEKLKNNHRKTDEILSKYLNSGIKILIKQDELYPSILKNFADSPEILYLLGDEKLLEKNLITIVGSRFCTRYGEQQTENIVKGLVENNIVIVSGLAEGIDTIASRTAFANGGKAIAVIAGGFNNVYPKSNISLFNKHAEEGLIISEHPPETVPSPYMFPMRNRIMGRIGLATVVTEAGEKSGSLITADYAITCGRDLFVLPANVNSKASKGCLDLLKSAQGAIFTDYKDILESLCLNYNESTGAQIDINLSDVEKLILDSLKVEDKHIEEILNLVNGDIGETTVILTVMEIKGLIKKLPSNYYGV